MNFNNHNDILNSIQQNIIIISENNELCYYNKLAENNIIFFNKNMIIGCDITNFLYGLNIIKYKYYCGEKMGITFKKQITGNMLYSSLSNIKTIIHFDTIINSFKNNNNQVWHTLVLNEQNNNNNNINFIAYLSHELRNPLQSIIISNYLIQKNNKEKNIDQYLITMNKSCDDMKKIIGDILDLAKIEAGELTIDIELCKIKDIIDYLKNNYDNIYINTKIDIDLEPFIYTDQVRLRQILINLITNAIKYTKNIIMVNIEINVSNNMIEFHVSDDGIGIKNDEIKSLVYALGGIGEDFSIEKLKYHKIIVLLMNCKNFY